MSKPKPWTPEEDAKLETLANAGKSWDAIAKVVGRSKSSCQSRASSPNSPVTLSEEGMHIRRARLAENMGNLRKTNVRTKKDTIPLIVPLIQRGLTTQEIANEIGITKHHLTSYYYKDAKELACPKGKLTQQILQRIYLLRKSGLSLREIGYHFCMCMESVRQIIRRASSDEPRQESPNSEEMFLIRKNNGNALPTGHPIVMQGLWRGLEKWRMPDTNVARG